jgi:choline dehydrogenase
MERALSAEQFDYIIVGAGSAGCVLARRLSDDQSKRVLLIEAGGNTNQWFIKMAAGFMAVGQRPEFFWEFKVDPMLDRSGDTQKYGRGLGGSSAVNGMWYLRGLPRDYDGWRDMGLREWSWSEIQRCYQWMESYREPGADPSRGRDGPLQITQLKWRDPIFDDIAEACKSLGVPWLDDINTPGTEGVGRTQFTVDRSGERSSSYTAFVAPIRSRPNLTIVTGVGVRRILFKDGKAIGVEGQREDRSTVQYAALQEVIVSAGVYNSPALLQRSGLGPSAIVSGAGVKVVKELPAVGANLCDHQNLSVSFDLHNHPGDNREFSGWRLYRHAAQYFVTKSGRLARVGMPLTMLYSTTGEKDWPDVQLAAAPFAMRSSKEMKVDAGRGPLSEKPGITFLGFDLRPKSRGSVRITSSEPTVTPLVDAGWWSDERDRAKSLVVLRTLRQLAAAEPLKR